MLVQLVVLLVHISIVTILHASHDLTYLHVYADVTVTFIPFGAAAGDNEVTLVGSEVMSLGPFDLMTPLVFYLQREYQLYVRTFVLLLLLLYRPHT